MKKQLVLTLLVLCLSLVSGLHPSFAQESDDPLAALQREGWKIVNEGVLQRELRPGKVESFVFGVPGFTWKIQDLRRQLQKLQAEFRANPTPELRKAIANHRKVIANAQRTLEIARTYEALGESGVPKESCVTNSYSSHATAGSKTDVQGVWAAADATYSGNCDAQVYAYVFAKTGVNGEPGPTASMTDGPRSAAGGPANVYVERNGGAPCESRAYSEISLGTYPPLSWSEDDTFECPSPLEVTVTSDAPSATIDLFNSDCITITWTANISGGTPPYSSTMYLNGVSQGAGPTYPGTWCNAGTDSSRILNVSATVTDSSAPARSKSGSAPVITIRSHVVVPPLDVRVTSNAPSATIDLYNSDCITIDWTTNISGGTSPYDSTMYLNGTLLEDPRRGTSRTSYSKRYCNAGTNTSLPATVSATVTDASSPVQSKSASAPTITIRSHVKPLAVTVTSNAPSTIVDLYNSDCITVTWTTNISGGTSPYSSTMYLNSASQGARTTFSRNYCNAKTNTSLTASVSATVTDSGSPVQSKSASAPTITIRSHVVVVSPLSVTVTSNAPSTIIDLYDADCITVTWTTNISGGTPSYTSTMYVNSASQGSRTTYSASYCNVGTNTSRTIAVSSTVTDGGSPVQSKSASAPTITIRSHLRSTTCYITSSSNKIIPCP
jgi:hypothetical protein